MLRTPKAREWAAPPDRRIYLVWIALVWAGMLGGFLPDLGRYMAETPPPPLVLHAHGAIYTLWLAVVTAQIALVETDSVRLHKTLGWWLVGLSVMLVVIGLVAAMVDMTRASRHPPFDAPFLGLEFQEMAVFGVLLWLAVRMRKDLAAHKRLMILLAVAILDPGTSRAFGFVVTSHDSGPLSFWLHYFWGNALMVLLIVAWDCWHFGRPHPALLAGAAVLAAGEATAVVLEYSPWWRVMAEALVHAWGWAG